MHLHLSQLVLDEQLLTLHSLAMKLHMTHASRATRPGGGACEQALGCAAPVSGLSAPDAVMEPVQHRTCAANT